MKLISLFWREFWSSDAPEQFWPIRPFLAFLIKRIFVYSIGGFLFCMLLSIGFIIYFRLTGYLQ